MPDRIARHNERFVARARVVSRAAGVLVVLVGAIALAGWLLDVELLKGLYGGITVKANTAVALLLAGASLLSLDDTPRAGWRRRAGEACAVLVGAIGLGTLSQHLVGWDLGIDQLLFDEASGAPATASPGRMGPPASFCFSLSGVSLLLLHRRRASTVAQAGAIGVGLAALLAVTGYAYGATVLYGVARFSGIALNTALALLALSAGQLAWSVDRGIASVVADDGVGSLLARRLLPLAMAVPLLLGWVRVRLVGAGYVEDRFGSAMLILTILVVLTTLVARTALMLNRVERQQLAAEATVRDRLHEIETMMEVLPIGVFIAKDRAAADIAGNGAAREILRLPRPEADRSLGAPLGLAQMRARVLHAGVEVPLGELPLHRAARDGVAVSDLELDVVFDDGVVRHVLLSARPLLDDRGSSRGAVASMMDVTARRAAEREREVLLAREREARADAEAANRAKDEFLANVSHELRTPLNGILGWALLLEEGDALDDAAKRRAAAAIVRNGRAQARLIEDLLDVSRVIAGSLRLEVKPVDLVEIVDAAVDIVRPAATARAIELRTVLAPAALQVRGDAARLQQVAWNLLTNAVKFSAERSVVEVRLAVRGSEAVLTVTDQGEGIDPEFLPHVFERFRQADGGRTRRFGGVGLGLSIARHLVEMHGGTIEAASEGIGRGASFIVRLQRLSPEPEPGLAEPGLAARTTA